MPTVVHFDINTDDPVRAKKFYEGMFNWTIEVPSDLPDYYLIETKDLTGNEGVCGVLGKMPYKGQGITTYFGVDSIGEYIDKVEKLGGTIIQSMITVPGRGYSALCLDTEKNLFGLWQYDKNAQQETWKAYKLEAQA